MHPKQTLVDLIRALDRNQRQLESHLSEPDSDVDVRPMLLRRRRAIATLRAALRYHGLPVPAIHDWSARGTTRHALHDLWHAERRMLSLYDAALARSTPGTPEYGLLNEQRAESEQALLSLTTAVHRWRPRSDYGGISYGSAARSTA